MSYWLVEKNKNLFLETGNPLYAWKAIENAWGFKYPIPDEIVTYIGEVAHELMKVTCTSLKPMQRPYAIAKALKLHKTGSGQGSVFTDYSKHCQDRTIALATAEKVNYYGDNKADYAFDDIANEYGISKSTVRRNFLLHSERWHLIAKKLIESRKITYDSNGNATMPIIGTADDFREAAEVLKEIDHIKKSG